MYIIQKNKELDQAVSKQEYRYLVQYSQDATVFNDWPWIYANFCHSKADSHLFLTCRSEKDNRLLAFIALGISTEKMFGIPLRIARFMQYPLGDRIGIAIHPDHLNAWEVLLASLAEETAKNWDLLIWNDWVDTQGLRERLIKWANAFQQTVFVKQSCFCPVLFFEGRTADEVSLKLSSKRRSGLRRCRKKLAKQQHQISHHLVSINQVDELLKEITKTESVSWKGDEQKGIFSNPVSQKFIREVSKDLATNNQLFISLLYIDNELVAYRYGFLFRDSFLDYSIGYIPKHSKLAPGAILLNDLINIAIDRGFKNIDASRVGAVSKHLLYDWTDRGVEHYRFYWFADNIKGKMIHFVLTWLKPHVKSLLARISHR